MEKPSFFQTKGAHTRRIFYDNMLEWDNVSVVHARIGSNLFTESNNSTLKIAIPFGQASIHASWQTVSGQQKRQHVKGYHVSIMPASLPYETRWEATSEIIILCFQSEFITKVAQESMIGNTVEIIEHWTAIDSLIRQLGSTLRHELYTGSPSRLYIDSLTTFLAIHLLKKYSVTSSKTDNIKAGLPHKTLQQVTDYIESHLEQDLSLELLAEFAHISPYRFARAFRQSVGLPPHQYLLQRRLERP